MKQYINKSDLVEALNKIIKSITRLLDLLENRNRDLDIHLLAKVHAYEDILDFVNALEVKELQIPQHEKDNSLTSEDVRIKKDIISYIKAIANNENISPDSKKECKTWIAWLEKQGEKSAEWHREDEQNLNACLGYIPDEFLRRWLKDAIYVKYEKPADKVEPKFKIGDTMRTLQEANDGYTDGMPVVISIDNEYYHCTNELIAIKDQDDYEFPPINVKQKHNNKTKFKVGDWCIDNEDGVIFQIVKVLDNTYYYKINEGKEYSCTHYSLENDAKLWTIKDAKKGDVLASGQVVFIFKMVSGVWLNCYCSAHNDGSFIADSYDLMKDKYFDEVYPANKEQRNLLFQKIREAGYVWDAESKQLLSLKTEPTREIMGNEVKISSKWSKEDEEEFKIAIETLHEAGQHSSAMWLKSIKQRMEE